MLVVRTVLPKASTPVARMAVLPAALRGFAPRLALAKRDAAAAVPSLAAQRDRDCSAA
jgi:hypothetical protein